MGEDGGASEDDAEHDDGRLPGHGHGAATDAATSTAQVKPDRKKCHSCGVTSSNGRLTWNPECTKNGDRGLMVWIAGAAQRLVFQKPSERRPRGTSGALSLRSTVPEISFGEDGEFINISYKQVDTERDTSGMSSEERADWDKKQNLDYHLSSDMMPALMYNPGKTENHSVILDSILTNVGNRSWAFLGLDGSPFLQVYKLVAGERKFRKFAVTCALGREGCALHAVWLHRFKSFPTFPKFRKLENDGQMNLRSVELH
jgi:hypothetical protein